jgi:hypothetical protein
MFNNANHMHPHIPSRVLILRKVLRPNSEYRCRFSVRFSEAIQFFDIDSYTLSNVRHTSISEILKREEARLKCSKYFFTALYVCNLMWPSRMNNLFSSLFIGPFFSILRNNLLPRGRSSHFETLHVRSSGPDLATVTICMHSGKMMPYSICICSKLFTLFV